MKKEALISLGITEEQAKAILNEHEAEISSIKQKLNTIKEEAEEIKKTAEDRIISNAIRGKIGDTAKDLELVMGLIDKQALMVSENGEVSGIEEQLNDIKENKAFLFKENVLTGISPIASNEPKAKSIEEMNYTELCKYLEENPNEDI